MTYVEHMIENAIFSLGIKNSSEEEWVEMEQQLNNKYAELSDDELDLIWEAAKYVVYTLFGSQKLFN